MREPDGILGEQLEDVVGRLERRWEPAAILLYGSAAQARLRPESDIDIAVLCDEHVPDAFEVASLRTDLESILGRTVDLVILNSCSPILAMEVLRQHRALRVRAPEMLERFTVNTLGAYFDLKRTRQPIEEALRGATSAP